MSSPPRRPAPVLALGVLALLAACGDEAAPAEARAAAPSAPWFELAESRAGIDFEHRRAPEPRYHFPEIMTGGAALFDADGDGDLDAYLVQGGDLDPAARERPTNRLFTNRGDGSFEDSTKRAGVGDGGYGMGVACGDYDGDGDVDLYVTNVGPNVLYRNEGDGTFTDVTGAAGVGHPGWGASAAFVDFDADGDLDLFVVNYIAWSLEGDLRCSPGFGGRDYCGPTEYDEPASDVLYENDGRGAFHDVTRARGLDAATGNGLGVVWGDLDGEGRVDLYVANDGTPNQLWVQRSDGKFRDRALLLGCAVNRVGVPEAGMGVAAADLDGDGHVELLVTHLRDESNTLYRFRRGVFEDVTALTGLGGTSIDTTGFGVGFADFDNDGQLDLYVANGRVNRWDPVLSPDDVYAEHDLLYRGLGDLRFEPVSPAGGTAGARIETSRAAAFGDVDDDGGVDVLLVTSHGPARLLRNVAASGHWVLLRVLDAHGRDALDAEVLLTAAGRTQRRRVRVASSYCASSDPRVHFGLGAAARVETLSVRWSDGVHEAFDPPPVDGVATLRRGQGREIP